MGNVKKAKKIIGVVVNVILWLFVVFAICVTVLAVSASANKKGVPTVGGKCYLSVESESMNAAKPSWVSAGKPSGFKRGDLIIGEYIAGNASAINKIEKGDVVTFETSVGGKVIRNSHRVIDVGYKSDGVTVDYLKTQGDNNALADGDSVYTDKIIAVYTGKKIAGVGGALSFLSSQTGFGLCILLPLAIFFAYELVVFIMAIVKVKNEGKKVISAEDEEMIKRAAVEEYLRQKAEAEGAVNPSADSDASSLNEP